MKTESLSEYVARELPHLTKAPMTDLQQRRLLCDDLYYLIKQDKDIAEELIDEYVYLLSDDRVKELQKLVDDELG